MLKNIKLFVAVLIMAATLTHVAFAAEKPYLNNGKNEMSEESSDATNHLRWSNVSGVSSGLTFSSGKANISFRVFGKTGTTYTNGTVKLKKIVGSVETTVATWSGLSGSTKTFAFSDNTVSVTSGTYKATLVIYAVRNGVSEKIEAEATATY